MTAPWHTNPPAISQAPEDVAAELGEMTASLDDGSSEETPEPLDLDVGGPRPDEPGARRDRRWWLVGTGAALIAVASATVAVGHGLYGSGPVLFFLLLALPGAIVLVAGLRRPPTSVGLV